VSYYNKVVLVRMRPQNCLLILLLLLLLLFAILTVLEVSGSSLFSLVSDWLPYKTVRKRSNQWASRFFQNIQWK